jgi:hypothetical protein
MLVTLVIRACTTNQSNSYQGTYDQTKELAFLNLGSVTCTISKCLGITYQIAAITQDIYGELEP